MCNFILFCQCAIPTQKVFKRIVQRVIACILHAFFHLFASFLHRQCSPFFQQQNKLRFFHFQCLQLSNLLKCVRCVSQALICGESLTWFCHISTPQRFCHISTPELSSPALSEPLPVSLLAAEHAIRGPGGDNLVDDDDREMMMI